MLNERSLMFHRYICRYEWPFSEYILIYQNLIQSAIYYFLCHIWRNSFQKIAKGLKILCNSYLGNKHLTPKFNRYTFAYLSNYGDNLIAFSNIYFVRFLCKSRFLISREIYSFSFDLIFLCVIHIWLRYEDFCFIVCVTFKYFEMP